MNREERISDDVLIEAFQKGEGHAASRLYYRYIDRVHRICYRIVLDHSQVKDCVQEVWQKVFRNLDRFQCGKSFPAWLNAITVNTSIDFYRKTIRRGNHVNIEDFHVETLIAEEQTGRGVLEENRIQRMIDRALQEISVSQRTAFILRYYEDLTTAEIAKALKCSEGTVRTHIRRSLLTLRDKLAVKLNR